MIYMQIGYIYVNPPPKLNANEAVKMHFQCSSSAQQLINRVAEFLLFAVQNHLSVSTIIIIILLL